MYLYCNVTIISLQQKVACGDILGDYVNTLLFLKL